MITKHCHILFVCSRNQWRSPTAVQAYAGDPRVHVRSAGLAAASPHRVTQQDLDWADLVLVMEQSHKTRLRAMFPLADLAMVEVLDIPDDYRFMDAELVELITEATEPLIAELLADDDLLEPESQ